MRKKIFVIFFAFFGIAAMNAQDQFKLGLAAGLPIGDSGDLSIFSIAVDLAYLFEINESIKAGPISGYSHSFGDKGATLPGTILEDGHPDVNFIPVGVGGRFFATENFVLGIDTGYSIGLSDDIDGGFYYSPRIQYETNQNVAIVAAYRGTAIDGGSWDIISLGVEFGFGGK